MSTFNQDGLPRRPRAEGSAAFVQRLIVVGRGALGTHEAADLALHVIYAQWCIQTGQLPRAGQPDRVLARLAEGSMRLSHVAPMLPPLGDDEVSAADRRRAETTDPVATRMFTELARADVEEPALIPLTDSQGLQSLFELVLAFRKSEVHGDPSVPRHLGHLIAALCVSPGSNVVDPMCGDGSALLAARAAGAGALIGWTPNRQEAQIARWRLAMHGISDAKINVGWWLDQDPSESAAILALPPFGMMHEGPPSERVQRLHAQYGLTMRGPTSQIVEMAWMIEAINSLGPGGRAAVIRTPASVHLSAQVAAAQHLIADGYVEAIVSLPQGTFAPSTHIAAVLWILRAKPHNVGRADVLMMNAPLLDQDLRGRGPRRVDNEQILATFDAFRTAQPLPVPGYVATTARPEDLVQARILHPKARLDEPPSPEVTHPAPERSKLTAIQLGGFKAFQGQTRVPLAPLTLIYGANSAGKSSIVQALHLIRQSANSPRLVTQGKLRDLGGFEGLLHRRATDRMTLGVEFGVLPQWLPSTGTVNPALERRISWTWQRSEGGAGVLDTVNVHVGDCELGFRVREDEMAASLTLPLNSAAEASLLAATDDLMLYPSPARAANASNRRMNVRRALRTFEVAEIDAIDFGAPTTLPTDCAVATVLPDMGRPQDDSIAQGMARKVAQVLGGVSAETHNLLKSLTWLGPLRSEPQRVYSRQQGTEDTGQGYEAAFRLFDAPALAEQVNQWLTQLEIPYTLEALPASNPETAALVGDLVTLALTDQRTETTVTPADVGFGISQSLPILVELLGQRDRIVAIEQPETHLHPRLQAHLADLFLDTVQPERQNNQVIVETHSEHLMLRIQRRIREEELDPDLVCVLYVDQQPGEGATVQRLRLNEDGHFIDEWPHGFFDERLEEIF